MPHRPSSAQRRYLSIGNSRLRSSAAARGFSTSSAKACTVSRSSSCSRVSWKSIVSGLRFDEAEAAVAAPDQQTKALTIGVAEHQERIGIFLKEQDRLVHRHRLDG